MQLALLATLLFAAVSVQADRFAGHPLNNALLPKRHTHSRRAPAYHLKKSYSGYDFLKLFRFASGSSENNGLVDCECFPPLPSWDPGRGACTDTGV